MSSSPIYVSGITQDGEPMIAGIYRMKDELGYPVDMAYEEVKERRGCPDWCEFLADAGRQKDWKFDDASEEMRLLVGDTIHAEIIQRFKYYGALIMAETKLGDFISICEEIVRRKFAGRVHA